MATNTEGFYWSCKTVNNLFKLISSTGIFLLLPTNSNICQITVLCLPYALLDFSNLSHVLSVPFPPPGKTAVFSISPYLALFLLSSLCHFMSCILFFQSFFFFSFNFIFVMMQKREPHNFSCITSEWQFTHSFLHILISMGIFLAIDDIIVAN